jgi:thioredoxin 1
MSAININKNNFESLNSEHRPVLVDFYADWCGACRYLSPVIDEIASENPEYIVAKVNVDDNPELASRFGIMSLPTLAVLKNGRLVQRSVGAKPKRQILRLLESQL